MYRVCGSTPPQYGCCFEQEGGQGQEGFRGATGDGEERRWRGRGLGAKGAAGRLDFGGHRSGKPVLFWAVPSNILSRGVATDTVGWLGRMRGVLLCCEWRGAGGFGAVLVGWGTGCRVVGGSSVSRWKCSHTLSVLVVIVVFVYWHTELLRCVCGGLQEAQLVCWSGLAVLGFLKTGGGCERLDLFSFSTLNFVPSCCAKLLWRVASSRLLKQSCECFDRGCL